MPCSQENAHKTNTISPAVHEKGQEDTQHQTEDTVKRTNWRTRAGHAIKSTTQFSLAQAYYPRLHGTGRGLLMQVCIKWGLTPSQPWGLGETKDGSAEFLLHSWRLSPVLSQLSIWGQGNADGTSILSEVIQIPSLWPEATMAEISVSRSGEESVGKTTQ